MAQENKNKIKTFLKFDTGKGGFENMMIVLAVTAVVVLILGVYFVLKVLLPSFQNV